MKKNLLLFVLLSTFFFLSASAQWSVPVNLSPAAVSAGLNESMGSCIGVSNDSIHVVWTDKINATHAILYYVRSLDTGLTWSNAIAITGANGNAWNPAIAVNGQNIHVVWREIDTLTNTRSSWYKHSIDGGNTWGLAVYIDSTSDWPGVAVSGNNVYIVNDRHITTSNSEIFFLRSLDNGATWSGEKQLTFVDLRSEDESITAQGSHIHMSWNDNRTGQFQIFYKESADYGVTWGPDVVVDLPFDYNTMVSINDEHVDVVACGAASGRYQLLLAQSPDTGATWPVMNNDLSNDTAHTYFLPHMTRDGCDLHVVVSSGTGAKYFHSGDGGTTWDIPVAMAGASFIAYTGNVLYVIYVNAGRIYYLRNPTGNAGNPCLATSITSNLKNEESGIRLYPNPFTFQTTIEVLSSENAKLKIFDLCGREILSLSFGDKNRLTIGRDRLSSGIYLYKVFKKETIIASGKMIAQ